ncbi:hypothetical protein DAEQUDRAFT_813539 [Daedalea quercina L-15889]|uniref:Uncharacterized protein n=1 Tax=Daedalea quercina L-15889 TaxID=1314783 RepID=A0A165N269_9APHY|nr:hypothetical protein DAEQUDRAFT_813539 [Daedalea quercina L-15889]
MARFILSLLIDVRLPQPELLADLVGATKALLDFLYMAQYSIHSTTTLDTLKQSLSEFHAKKDIFIELGACSNFLIPKLHMMIHYARAIELYGTTDNYNTESTERLHIDFAKEAYRATNHKDEFPQMTKWLERREKVLQHASYIEWRLLHMQDGHLDAIAGLEQIRWRPPDMACTLHHLMMKHPSRKAVSLAELVSPEGYGAIYLTSALARFVVETSNPGLTRSEVEAQAVNVHFPFSTLPVFHKIKLRNLEHHGKETLDSIHARPRRVGRSEEDLIPARFDTALIRVHLGSGRRIGLTDMRIGRIRVIFSIPENLVACLLPSSAARMQLPRHLIYIEWLSKFTSPDQRYQMYKVSRLVGSVRIASVVPLALIERMWAPLDNHHRLQTDGKPYAVLAKRVALVKARRFDIEHVHATSDPCQALSAPANEIVHYAVRSGREVGALERLVGMLVGALRRAFGVSLFWGRIAEREGTICLVTGWSSVEMSWHGKQP